MHITAEFYEPQRKPPFWVILAILAIMIVTVFITIRMARADEPLLVSWYSRASLVRDGQDKITHFIMANGKEFRDDNFTAATRLYPLGTWLRIRTLDGRKFVVVLVSDRIGKRFAKTRIDLSKKAMEILGGKQALIQGLLPVTVEVIND